MSERNAVIEECAKVCREIADAWRRDVPGPQGDYAVAAANECKNRIRALRGAAAVPRLEPAATHSAGNAGGIPREPTEAMLIAGQETGYIDDVGDADYNYAFVWKAMYDAWLAQQGEGNG